MIFCYNGNSFAPPQNLRIGDKIKVDNKSYGLFSFICGFAGNSYGFALVDEIDYRFLSYESKRDHRRKCVRTTKIFIEKRNAVFALANALKDEEYFWGMTIVEFSINFNAAKQLQRTLEMLIEYTIANKTYIIDYLEEIRKIEELATTANIILRRINEFSELLLNESECHALSAPAEGFHRESLVPGPAVVNMGLAGPPEAP